jgi:hypothetical protein
VGGQYFGRLQTQLCTLRCKYFVVANLVQSMWATCVMTGKGRARCPHSAGLADGAVGGV